MSQELQIELFKTRIASSGWESLFWFQMFFLHVFFFSNNIITLFVLAGSLIFLVMAIRTMHKSWKAWRRIR